MMLMPSQFDVFICMAKHKESLQVFFVNKAGDDMNVYLSTIVSSITSDPRLYQLIKMAIKIVDDNNLNSVVS